MMNVTEQHALSDQTKTVVFRKCWSLIFDVNGNAPGDATVASFATKELADQALSLWGGMKDDNRSFAVVVGGKKHFEPMTYSVEGWNFDTFYSVIEDWQEDKNILTSLSELSKDCFDCEEDTDLADGVYLEEGEGEEAGDDEG